MNYVYYSCGVPGKFRCGSQLIFPEKHVCMYIYIFFTRVVRVHVCERSLLRVWLRHLLGWLTDLVTERLPPHLLTAWLRVWLVYGNAGSVGLPAKRGAEWKRSARLSRGCTLIKFSAAVWTIWFPGDTCSLVCLPGYRQTKMFLQLLWVSVKLKLEKKRRRKVKDRDRLPIRKLARRKREKLAANWTEVHIHVVHMVFWQVCVGSATVTAIHITAHCQAFWKRGGCVLSKSGSHPSIPPPPTSSSLCLLPCRFFQGGTWWGSTQRDENYLLWQMGLSRSQSSGPHLVVVSFPMKDGALQMCMCAVHEQMLWQSTFVFK